MGRERRRHSGLVRAEFERICKQDWADLVERRARQLADDLRTAPDDPMGRVFVSLTRQGLYEMVRDNPSYAPRIREIVERYSRTTWVDLERAVKTSRTL